MAKCCGFPMVFVAQVLAPRCRYMLLKTTVNRLVAGSNPAREPNLRFCQIGPFAGRSLRGYGRRFCQQVKWLPQIGNHLPALPGAVRNYEIEKPTFFARFLLLEQSLS